MIKFFKIVMSAMIFSCMMTSCSNDTITDENGLQPQLAPACQKADSKAVANEIALLVAKLSSNHDLVSAINEGVQFSLKEGRDEFVTFEEIFASGDNQFSHIKKCPSSKCEISCR